MFRFRSLRGRVAVVVVVGGWLSFLVFGGELRSAGGGGGGSGGMIGKCMPFRGRGAASGRFHYVVGEVVGGEYLTVETCLTAVVVT